MLAMALMTAVLAAGSASAADQTYVAARGGIFLPNGRDGGDYKGFKYFDTGYSFDIAAGYRPVSYAAVEVGTGLYTASGKITQPGFSIDRTAYGVPITLTAKGIIEFDKLILSGGGGIGLYQGFIDNKISFPGTPVDESNHGTAVGYQAVFDADFKLNEKWAVGANFKWFSARPEIELTTVSQDGSSLVRNSKDKWEIGGTTVNIGVKYSF
jgi:opacity protein-like surface antigen